MIVIFGIWRFNVFTLQNLVGIFKFSFNFFFNFEYSGLNHRKHTGMLEGINTTVTKVLSANDDPMPYPLLSSATGRNTPVMISVFST